MEQVVNSSRLSTLEILTGRDQQVCSTFVLRLHSVS